MRTLYFLRGLPASCKTTYCLNNLMHAMRSSKDDLRAMAYWVRDDGPYLYNAHNEGYIRRAHYALMKTWLELGRDVIDDNTNLKASDLQEVRVVVGNLAKIEIVDLRFTCSLEECLERNRNRMSTENPLLRKRPIPEQDIINMHARYIEPYKYRQSDLE